MKFMLMMNSGQEAWKAFTMWSPDDFRAHIAFMHEFNRTLRASGELIAAEGLAPPQQARSVRAAADGQAVVSETFPAVKEFLAGYWIVEVSGPERAFAIASLASAAPGPGGAPMNMPIEVRQIVSGPPKESTPDM